jgi:hypothetical protein
MLWTQKGLKQLEKEVAGIEKIDYTEQPHKITFVICGTEKSCQKVKDILETSKPAGLSISIYKM